MTVKLWLRSEKKEKERRTPLTPKNAKTLIDLGAEITVEDDPNRIFPISDYQEAGCKITAAHSWPAASHDNFILGLKEITDENVLFSHKHIYFAHIYKGQEGSDDILRRYKEKDGLLFDLEYLVDENQRRIAAFGHWAGFAGAAFALDRFYHQQFDSLENYPPLQSYEDISSLKKSIDAKRDKATIQSPKVLIIGALGRCGKGAAKVLEYFDIDATKWDYQETKEGGPFIDITSHDIFINAALINKKIPPFIDKETIHAGKGQLKIIADVSCDPNSDLNPIPLYHQSTTWDHPLLQLKDLGNLEILSVDNLPSTLPLESSEDFSDQLLPWLKELVIKKGSLPLPFLNAQKTFQQFIK